MDAEAPFIHSSIYDAFARNQSTEACSENGKKAVNEVSEVSCSENYSSLKPDFSLLEGEICLDNFSVRELQEAFRATFGRHTSIDDKLWLKRRIAMGLTNSCDIPSTNFIIKDNKIVLSDVKEKIASGTQSNLSSPVFMAMNESTDPLNETLEETLNDTSTHIEKQQASSTQELDKSLEKCNEDNFNAQTVQCGTKRIRRPTKRYIEEHSEVEVMQCSGRIASLGKDDIDYRYSLKSKVRAPCLVDTSQGLFGGYDARIPCVLRVRRRPPRKNFLALVNFVHVEREKMSPEVFNSEKSPQENHVKFISSGSAAFHENSDSGSAAFHENSDTLQPMESSKKKNHRAWTLGEVLKLVEGVSMYGVGRWSQIRQVAFASGSHRTSVDLKIGKPACLSVPAPVLLRVRELADKRSHSGIEFGSGQFVGLGGIVQEKKTGFL
ncbi:uncharacterized protein LOC110026023 isoform X2 [Phalaenopsis equestris]|uniref:uncharacterized protein LOC110026023 isoform X2 n=1 Tax=Phalaenopsis equestris TaxID=78828 RepID=UPI0009E533FB|nr:uncharacterized protein LOC110026023 isoform X2 [Phalaenopsis equestris]